MQAKKYPGITIYGGSNKAPAVNDIVTDKREFTIGDNIQVKYDISHQANGCSH